MVMNNQTGTRPKLSRTNTKPHHMALVFGTSVSKGSGRSTSPALLPTVHLCFLGWFHFLYGVLLDKYPPSLASLTLSSQLHTMASQGLLSGMLTLLLECEETSMIPLVLLTH